MNYRGFDIDKMKDGTFRVSLGVAAMKRSLESEESARAWVDTWKAQRHGES